MDEMRRIGIFVVALGSGLSFVAVCLAACLMGPAVADHGCCSGEDGMKAAESDCCLVTPGVSHGGAQVAATLPAITAVAPSTIAVPRLVAPAKPVAASTSPPFVIRV
jgi:hypothetical protein